MASCVQESGLLELEAGVLGFLASRSAVLRLVAALDDLERLVAQVTNNNISDSSCWVHEKAAGDAGGAGDSQQRQRPQLLGA